MKRLFFFMFLVIIILFSANSLVFCQDIENRTEIQKAETHEAAAKEHNTRKYSFGIAPLFGIVHGQSIELVYPTNTKGKFLSELLWDIKPVFYLGLEFEVKPKKIMNELGFLASAAVKIGIPGDTGIMEDRDWQSIENNALTNFSSHTNKTNEFYWIDLVAGISVPLKYSYIAPYISGSWMRFSFAGRDGYRRYARTSGKGTYYPINDNPDTGDFTGKVIEYEQNWFLLAPGFTIGTDILSPFSFNLSFQISPLIYCMAVDQHLLIGDTYYDFTSFGLFLEPKINVSYKFKMLDFSLEFAYRYINSRGKTYKRAANSNRDVLVANKSGTGLSTIDVRFLLGINF